MRQRAANLRVSPSKASLRNALFAIARGRRALVVSGRRPSPLSGSELPRVRATTSMPASGDARLSLPRFRLEAVSSRWRPWLVVRHWSDPSATTRPPTAKLPDFETNRSASSACRRDRPGIRQLHLRPLLRILWPGGRSRYTYALSFEDGTGRVDLTESGSQEPPNQAGAPCFVQQVYSALRSHARSSGNN